jgi:hypothetical protein
VLLLPNFEMCVAGAVTQSGDGYLKLELVEVERKKYVF